MFCANINFLVLTVDCGRVKCHHWGKSTWDFSILFLQLFGSLQFFKNKMFWEFPGSPVVKTQCFRDLPGGPVVKNPPYNAGDTGLIPGQGTKIPHAAGQLSLCADLTRLN